MKAPLNKVTAPGLVIALGIIYGDIGTSPLYVFNAIITDRTITEQLIIGALSCIIWTLTLQTTIKYVFLVLQADNRGEGGTFALYALVRRQKRWLVIPAMIGGAALLADGIITPPISITSAVEGLKELPRFRNIEEYVVYIVLVILAMFFFLQQFGTASIGKFFGPLMFIWFSMLALLGIIHLSDDFTIFRAFSPHYAVDFLTKYPKALWMLGAVFLCTTGAEALYSDLGHCGRGNIRVSWTFVKACLLLNYLGQGAFLLHSYKGLTITEDVQTSMGINAFYDLMPQWFIVLTQVFFHHHKREVAHDIASFKGFVPAGDVHFLIATMAAIIASQAMISGSFTLISEAMRLNLWPKLKIRYPSEARGQLFIPFLNFFMFIGCAVVVLYFQTSKRMEAAYGLAIIVTMLMTTILFSNFMISRRVRSLYIWIFLAAYHKYLAAVCKAAELHHWRRVRGRT